MEISLKKWFSNSDGTTRYKVVVPAVAFLNCPVKEVHISAFFQVMKKEGEGYRLSLFGESREGWFESAGVVPTWLSWKDEVLNTANGIHQWSSPWMKKKELMSVLEKVVPMEISSWKNNALMQPEFRNLKLL
jgi:hypothetical protein